MPFNPDQRPSRRQDQDIERAPSIPEAAKMLFGLFGEEIGWNTRIPQVAEELLKKKILFPSFDGYPSFIAKRGRLDEHFWWESVPPSVAFRNRAETDEYTPDSPLIFPENVGYASRLVTVTYLHHFLGWGPDHDLVFGQKENDDYRAYWYPKHTSRKTDGSFKNLDSWRTASRILLETPEDAEQQGNVYELWKSVGMGSHYALVAGFFSRRASMLDLLLEMSSVDKRS